MSAAFVQVAIHASEHPAAQRATLLGALRARRLPAKLLYQSPAQARRWLDYHAAWSPSHTDSGVRALYREACAAGAEAAGAAPALAVGLGCGGGAKEAGLVAALAARGEAPPPVYVPLDASVALVLEAAGRVQACCPAVRVHPLVADLGAAPELESWLAARAPMARRVYTCFGVLPNQDPRAFPAWLGRLLRPGDTLLVSANLAPGGLAAARETIVPQYDNPPARAWYGGALGELGLAPEAWRLRVDARALSPDGAAWQVVVAAVLQRDAALALPGATVALGAGESLQVLCSNRFTVEAAERVLGGAGLRPVRRWLAGSGEEGVWLCARD